MKNNKLIVSLLTLLAIGSIQSCEQEKIEIYKQEAGVFFSGFQTIYSFVENINKIEQGYDIVKIPVLITGKAVDKDRVFGVVFDKQDTLHTAEDGMITLEGGIVTAGSYGGYIAVKINYSNKLDDSIYVARIGIKGSEDFTVIDLNGGNYSIQFGNIFTRPENWNKLQVYFGPYSNSWYKFILQTTELPSLPYKYSYGKDEPSITPEEAERWPMNMHEVKSYAMLVKTALADYNNDHPNNPLKHEDGDKIGQPVVMPNL